MCLHEKSPNRKNPAFDKDKCGEIAVGTVSNMRIGLLTMGTSGCASHEKQAVGKKIGKKNGMWYSFGVMKKEEKQPDELDDKVKMAKKNETDEKLKKVKKKVVGGATAAGLGASVLLGGLFDSPEELTQKTNEAFQSQQPSPIIMTVDLDEEDTDEDNDSEETNEEESLGLFAKIKKKILAGPFLEIPRMSIDNVRSISCEHLCLNLSKIIIIDDFKLYLVFRMFLHERIDDFLITSDLCIRTPY